MAKNSNNVSAWPAYIAAAIMAWRRLSINGGIGMALAWRHRKWLIRLAASAAARNNIIKLCGVISAADSNGGGVAAQSSSAVASWRISG